MKLNPRTFALSAILMGLMVFAIGCSEDDDAISNPGTSGGDTAMLRVIHASPDAPAVDVYVVGPERMNEPVLTDFSYGDVSPYLELAAGDYTVQLRASGAAPDSEPAFETEMLTIPAGASISALAAGLLGSADAEDRFRVLTLVEGFEEPGMNNAAVRIVHASSDAPTVALDVGNDGVPELTNFARFADTGAAGVALPSGQALQIAVWAGNPLQRVTVFTTPELPEGAELFVIATGLLARQPDEADGFSLLAATPDGAIGFIRQNPVVFALHGSPDAPPVDIYAGAGMLSGDLAFGELSEPIQVPPGAYTLEFKAAGSIQTAASATTPELTAGMRYLAIASGFLSSGPPDFQLIPLSDSFELGNPDAVVRVVHASPDAPPVDVGTVSEGVLTPVDDYRNLAFGQASSALGSTLPLGTLPIGIAAAGTSSPVATFDVTTGSGVRAYAVAIGSLFGNGESFGLVIVDTSAFPWSVAQATRTD